MLPSFRIAMAAAKLFPPGAAQESSTFIPGSAPLPEQRICGRVLNVEKPLVKAGH